MAEETQQPAEVTLTIDGETVTVPREMNLIQAAAKAGIEIPSFCFHHRLSVAGNCRICLVEIEKMPKNQIACSTRVAPGMVVKTRSEKAVKGRQGVMEFLLINHPLDCPICDKAGECILQSHSFHYGTGQSRFEGEKVHGDKQVDLGPHIVFDAERCIKCTRCIRFCDEVTHTHELGFFNRGDHSIIGTFPGRRLDNAYSGCTSDICPVGALTVKEFRFKQRVWFLKNTASICSGCARGCNVYLGIHQNRIWRIMPRESEAVNKSWICDEGRLSYERYQIAERLADARSGPMVGTAAGTARPLMPRAAWEEAAATLGEVARKHGGASIAAITSGHATLEEQAALAELMRTLGGTRTALPVHERGEDDGLLIRKDKTMNSRGALLIGGVNARLDEIVAAAAKGEIRALIVLREDPIGEGGEEAGAALGTLDLLLTLDWRVTPTVRASDLALPVCAYGELDGSAMNFEGRLQLLRPGLLPHGESDPAWRPLYEMVARLGGEPAPQSFRDAFRRSASRPGPLFGLDTPAVGTAGLDLANAKEP
ncbi:MAG TPA: 2Fe-2S iron-sulfur cluster-binding protein [Candidatus Polarisedimenticolia bacterium]|jgi:NADH-quinone oxidoreductase subunit G|nr:2Fe-2S iron-sulfur cluster-binding protein [Candidatus Polarisedimenticolia bacterium]